MKKALMIVGIIFLILIILAVVGIVKGIALNKEGKAYVDKVVPIILEKLDKETLFKYSSQDLINSASPEDFDKIFNWFKQLGQFKEYKESEGQANISYTMRAGKIMSAQYVAQVEFETGPATVEVTIIKKNGNWYIQGFKINSLALIPSELNQTLQRTVTADTIPGAELGRQGDMK